MNTFFSGQDNKILLSIEGNIGAGKSTFLKKIKENFLNAGIIFEPHEEWQNVKGYNLLDAFYKDTKRWAYSFQNYAFLTRSKCIENFINSNLDKDLFFAERSVYADFYTFARALNSSSLMNDLEWNMYKNWHSWISERYIKKPDAFLYLRVSPETSFKRIEKRKRSEEDGISFDYLKTLNDYHEDWLFNSNYSHELNSKIPVLVLDGEIDFENNEDDLNLLLSKINDFIENKINFDFKKNNFLKVNQESENLNF